MRKSRLNAWTTDGAILLDKDDSPENSLDLNVYRLELDDNGDLHSQRVIEFPDSLDPEALTLATGLPVEDLATPRWAQHRGPIYLGLGLAAGVLLLTGIGWWRRRYLAARAAR